ncbi:MAG: putative lipid II flippase FtsW [Candidatus Sumerlaeia bacterium]|nr:putative lipid II flippase FtsW [Candidatus Sumerlaeia bacterium]
MNDFLAGFRSPAGLLMLVASTLFAVGVVAVFSASGARAGLEEGVALSAQEALSGDGLARHYAATYAVKQAVWGALGIAAMALLASLPAELWRRAAPWLLGFAAVLLVLVIVGPLGVESKGARRWLRLGPVTIQPAEFAKIALVLFMARMLAENRLRHTSFTKGFLPPAAVLGVFAALILLEKDLGMTALVCGACFSMWILARLHSLYLAAVAVAGLAGGVLLVLTQSYRVNRILAFLDPDKYALTHAYQLNQSLIAVGSGGMWGQGLGMSLQKYHFLSEAHTDFIFAIVSEELGFVGASAVVLLYLAFLSLGIRTALRAPDYFSALAAGGLTLLVGIGAFINFFVVLGLAPTKGLTLPFLSYGGSSILASFIVAGLLAGIANSSAEPGLAAEGSHA